MKKTNQVAAICSFFCPGLGQLISGKPFSAVLWFGCTVMGYFFIVPGIIMHISCVVSASKIGVKA